MSPSERALFIFDGPNFYKNLLSARIARGHLDFIRLANNLAMNRKVTEVLFFSSPVDQATDSENYKAQQKFFAALQKSGVTLNLGKLVKRNVACKKCRDSPIKCLSCGEPQVVKTEKSVDVRIALQIVIDCIANKYDVLYLGSCDSDLVPAVEFVTSAPYSKKVFLLLPSGAKGYAIGSCCTATIPVTQDLVARSQVV